MKKTYFYEIQLIRLLAAILVVISHCGIMNIGGGAWSVSFFLVLSGFLAALSHKESDKGIALVRHRVKKVYPFLFVTMMVDLAVMIFGNKISCSISDLVGCISSLLLLHSWFYGIVRLNSVAWFISSLLFCTALTPTFIKKISSRMGSVSCVIWIVMGFFIELLLENALYGYDIRNFLTYNFPPVRFIDYSCGIVMYQLVTPERRKSMRGSLLQIFSIICLFVVNLGFPYIEAVIGRTFYTSIFLPVSLLCVFSFVQYEPVHLRLPERMCVLAGNMSMYIYMTHWVILDFLLVFLPDWNGKLKRFLFVLGMSLAVSGAYIIYSKKRMNLNERKSKRSDVIGQ